MKKYRPVKDGKTYRQLWRVVDGAVRDCIEQHPEYFVHPDRARLSINKRVTGSVLGFAEESARGRSGETPAADKTEAVVPTPRSTGVADNRRRLWWRLWPLGRGRSLHTAPPRYPEIPFR